MSVLWDGVVGPIHQVSSQGSLGPAACIAVDKAIKTEWQRGLFVEEKFAVFRGGIHCWSFRIRRISERASLITE